MHPRILLIFIIVLIITSCNDKQSEQKRKQLNLQAAFMGQWIDSLTGHATFEVRKDSIYYFDYYRAYPYIIKDDSLTIYFPDKSTKGELIIDKDTATFVEREFGNTKMVRFKQR
jgi:hypothetical protein